MAPIWFAAFSACRSAYLAAMTAVQVSHIEARPSFVRVLGLNRPAPLNRRQRWHRFTIPLRSPAPLGPRPALWVDLGIVGGTYPSVGQI